MMNDLMVYGLVSFFNLMHVSDIWCMHAWCHGLVDFPMSHDRIKKYQCYMSPSLKGCTHRATEALRL